MAVSNYHYKSLLKHLMKKNKQAKSLAVNHKKEIMVSALRTKVWVFNLNFNNCTVVSEISNLAWCFSIQWRGVGEKSWDGSYQEVLKHICPLKLSWSFVVCH